MFAFQLKVPSIPEPGFLVVSMETCIQMFCSGISVEQDINHYDIQPIIVSQPIEQPVTSFETVAAKRR